MSKKPSNKSRFELRLVQVSGEAKQKEQTFPILNGSRSKERPGSILISPSAEVVKFKIKLLPLEGRLVVNHSVECVRHPLWRHFKMLIIVTRA